MYRDEDAEQNDEDLLLVVHPFLVLSYNRKRERACDYSTKGQAEKDVRGGLEIGREGTRLPLP